MQRVIYHLSCVVIVNLIPTKFILLFFIFLVMQFGSIRCFGRFIGEEEKVIVTLYWES